MIRGIIGYKVRRDKDVEPILMKLKSHAMHYLGFVSSENLVSEKNISIVAIASTWETIENWRTWQELGITQDLL